METLGSVTVLGTDKTGTLTEGTMVARRAWTPAGEAVITGAGYQPHGQVLRDGQSLGPATDPATAALLAAGALCNDAGLHQDGDRRQWAAVGDPTEAALLAGAAKFGLPYEELRQAWPRVAEVPFDSGRKRMTTVHRRLGGGVRVLCKGAPEVLLDDAVIAEDAGTVARAQRSC